MSRLKKAGDFVASVASGSIEKTLKAGGLALLGISMVLFALDGCRDTSWDQSQDTRLHYLEGSVERLAQDLADLSEDTQ